MTDTSFRASLLKARPDIADRAAANDTKRKLALALRALRKRQDLTQRDIEHRSTLSQSLISRLESPTGPMPNFDTVMRYVEACGGHLILGFSLSKLDADSYWQGSGDQVVSAMAV